MGNSQQRSSKNSEASALQEFFRAWATGILAHPRVSLCFGLAIIIATTPGVFQLKRDGSLSESYQPFSAQSLRAEHLALFPSQTADPYFRVLVLPKGSNYILGQEALAELEQLDKKIKEHKEPEHGFSYGDLCLSKQNAVAVETEGYLGLHKSCYSDSVLELVQRVAQPASSTSKTAEDIAEEIRIASVAPFVSASGFAWDPTQTVSPEVLQSNGTTGALLLHYPLTSKYEMKNAVEDWQNFMLESPLFDSMNWKALELHLEADPLSYDGAVKDSGAPSRNMLVMSMFFTCVITWLHIVYIEKFTPVRFVLHRQVLVFAGILSSASGLLVAAGLSGYLEVPWVSLTSGLSLLVMAKSMDDLLIIKSCYDRIAALGTLQGHSEIFVAAITEAGPSILATSGTDALALALGSTTNFPVLKAFCATATMAVIADFLLEMLIFVPIFSIYYRAELSVNRLERVQSALQAWGRFVTKPAASFSIVMLFTILLGFGGFAFTKVPEGLEISELAPDSSTYQDYIRNYHEFFGQFSGPQVDVVLQDVQLLQDNEAIFNLEKNLLQTVPCTSLRSIREALSSFSASSQNYAPWLRDCSSLMSGVTATPTERDLTNFFASPLYQEYRADIGSNGKSLRLRVNYPGGKFGATVDNADAMHTLQREVSTAFGADAYTWSRVDGYLQQIEFLRTDVAIMLGTCVAAVLIITFAITRHLGAVALGSAAYLFLSAYICTLMFILDLKLNLVSFSCIMFGIGIFIDPVLHLMLHIMGAYSKALSEGEDQKTALGSAVTTALADIGPALLNATFSTLLGTIPVSFASSNIMRTFGLTCTLVVLASMIASFVLLPALICTFRGCGFGLQNIRLPSTAARQTPASKKDAVGDDEVVIVGMGAKLPGTELPELKELFSMLASGTDATSEVPEDRFDVEFYADSNRNVPGKMYVNRGGFVKDFMNFDSNFWGIPRDEAARLDPQVRILLQTTLDAFTDAGINVMARNKPDSKIKGQGVGIDRFKCGVFTGVTASEYLCMQTVSKQYENVNGNTNIGTNSCMVANRISYEFDLNGPTFSVDTACSSSLIAVYLAYESILNGHCNMAVAAGVNSLMTPMTTIGFCKAQMMSPDGRCKSFDDRADGYARAEGAGSVILMKHREAIELGIPVYAVIRGGTMSGNGRTKGIATPSAEAQTAMIQRALSNANTSPEEVGYVEAHGTGTGAGDLAEATAIGEAIGKHRGNQEPLRIGSIKSNMGHLESGSGIAGFIKLVLQLHEAKILPLCKEAHQTKSSKIPWQELKVTPATEYGEWTSSKGQPRVGCISSFGFGGANAHMVLASKSQLTAMETCKRVRFSGEAEHQPRRKSLEKLLEVKEEPQYQLLRVSAKSAESLATMESRVAAKLLAHKSDSQISMDQMLQSFNKIQPYFARTTVFGRSVSDLVGALQDDSSTHRVTGSPEDTAAADDLVFVFSGMGTQWPRMATQLADEFPIVAETLSEIDAILASLGASFALSSELRKEDAVSNIARTDVAQPAIIAVEICLFKLLGQYGVKPAAIIGHSIGEVAAAYAAGVLDLKQAITVAYHRGKLLELHAEDGAMIAVNDTEDKIRRLVAELGLDADIAAVNSPQSTVVSGPSKEVAKLEEACKAAGIGARQLRVTRGFHSRGVEAAQAKIVKALGKIRPSAPGRDCPMLVSTVTGHPVEISDGFADASYWGTNTRNSVKFAQGVRFLLKAGYSNFVEVAPASHLLSHVRDCSEGKFKSRSKLNLVPTLQPPSSRNRFGPDQSAAFMHSLATLSTLGYPVDTTNGRQVETFLPLPSYPWHGEQLHAVASDFEKMITWPMKSYGSGKDAEKHVMLGKRSSPTQFDSNLRLTVLPWALDHVLLDQVIIPGAGILETFLQAGQVFFGKNRSQIAILNANFMKAVMISQGKNMQVTTLVETKPRTEELSGSQHCHLSLVSASTGKMVEHSYCDVIADTSTIEPVRETGFDISAFIQGSHEVTSKACYDYLKAFGTFGPSFRGISHIWFHKDPNTQLITRGLAKIVQTERVAADYAKGLYNFHPAHLDAVLHFGLMIIAFEKRFVSQIPYRMGRCQMFAEKLPSVMYCQSTGHHVNSTGLNISFKVWSPEGDLLFIVDDLQFKMLESTATNSDVFLWESIWEPLVGFEEMQQGPQRDRESLKIVLVGDAQDAVLKPILQKSLGLQDNNVMSLPCLASPAEAGNEFKSRILDLINLGNNSTFVSGTLTFITTGAFSITGEEHEINPAMRAIFGVLTAIGRELCDKDQNKELAIRFIDREGQLTNLQMEQFAEQIRVTSLAKFSPSDTAVRFLKDRPGAHLYQRTLYRDRAEQRSVLVGSQNWKLEMHHDVDGSSFRPVMSSALDSSRDASNGNPASIVPRFVTAFAMTTGRSMTLALSEGEAPHIFWTEDTVSLSDELNAKRSIEVPKQFLGRGQHALCGMLHGISSFLEPAFVHQLLNTRQSGKLLILIDSSEPQRGLKMATFTEAILRSQESAVQMELGLHHAGELDKDAGAEAMELLKKFDCKLISSSEFHDRHSSAPASLMISSLSSYATERAVGYLAPGGVLVHLPPENDHWITIDTRMDMAIQSVDICSRISSDVNTTRSAMISVMRLYEDGFLTGHSEFEVVAASDLVQLPKETGRGLVVDMKCENVPVPLNLDLDHFQVASKSLTLVFGGHKGLGFEVTKWLVEHCGAKAVVLVGSSATMPDEVQAWGRTQGGVALIYRKCDVSNADQVALLFKSLRHNIRNIFFLAAMYDDKMVSSIKGMDDLKKSFDIKAAGAWNVHKASVDAGLELDVFFMSSSITTMLGSAGQALYISSNYYLEGLAEMRRAKGLPATVTCFGVVSDVGRAKSANLVSTWEKKGVKALPAQLLNKTVGYQIASKATCFGIGGAVDFEVNLQKSPILLKSVVEHGHMSNVTNHIFPVEQCRELLEQVHKHASVLDELDMQPDDEARKLVVQREVKGIIHSLLEVDFTNATPLVDIGVDSLIANSAAEMIATRFERRARPTALTILNETTTVETLSAAVVFQIQSNDMEEAANFSMKWFEVHEADSPETVLVCLPANAMGPSMFQGWPEFFCPKATMVLLAQFPGWGSRENETPVNDLESLVSEFSEALTSFLIDRFGEDKIPKIVLYGHSMGGLISYAVGQHLTAESPLKVSAVVVGAWFSVTAKYPVPAHFKIDSQELRDASEEKARKTLSPLPFLDAHELDNPEVLALVQRCVAAGLDICKTLWAPADKPSPTWAKLLAPKPSFKMIAVAGRTDRFIPAASIQAWKDAQPQGGFEYHCLDSGHKFLPEMGDSVMRLVLPACTSGSRDGSKPSVSSELTIQHYPQLDNSQASSHAVGPSLPMTVEDVPMHMPGQTHWEHSILIDQGRDLPSPSSAAFQPMIPYGAVQPSNPFSMEANIFRSAPLVQISSAPNTHQRGAEMV